MTGISAREGSKWFTVLQASKPSFAKIQTLLEEAMAITRCSRQSFKEGAGSHPGTMVILSRFCNLLSPTRMNASPLARSLIWIGWESAVSMSNALLSQGRDWSDALKWKGWAWLVYLNRWVFSKWHTMFLVYRLWLDFNHHFSFY